MTTTPPPVEPEAGPIPEDNQPGHHPEVEQDKPTVPPAERPSAVHRFEFEFEPAFRAAALPFGIRPGTAVVEVDGHEVRIRFGPWRVRFDRDDVVGAEVSGPYQLAKVIGPARLSLADRGLTFATNQRRGVCIRLRRPVRGIDPLGLLRHPAVTVTVADPDALAERLTG
jgi:hypothetical protein